MILSAADLIEITERHKPSAQARVLDALGVNYKRRPNGSIVVFTQDLHAPTQTRPQTPQLRLPPTR